MLILHPLGIGEEVSVFMITLPTQEKHQEARNHRANHRMVQLHQVLIGYQEAEKFTTSLADTMVLPMLEHTPIIHKAQIVRCVVVMETVAAVQRFGLVMAQNSPKRSKRTLRVVSIGLQEAQEKLTEEVAAGMARHNQDITPIEGLVITVKDVVGLEDDFQKQILSL